MNAENILQAMNQRLNLSVVILENKTKIWYFKFKYIKEIFKNYIHKYILSSEMFGSVDYPKSQNYFTLPYLKT